MWIPVGRLVVDPDVNPRDGVDWRTIARYADAMRQGSVFPPILVGRRRSRLVIIDGVHRAKAAKIAKIKRIPARLTRVPPRQWYAFAVRENTVHGLALSQFERRRAIIRLREEGLPDKEIAKIVRIPENRITVFLADRVVQSRDNRILILKAPLDPAVASRKNYATTEHEQELVSGEDVWSLVRELLILFKGGHVKPRNEKEVSMLESLASQVGRVLRVPARHIHRRATSSRSREINQGRRRLTR